MFRHVFDKAFCKLRQSLSHYCGSWLTLKSGWLEWSRFGLFFIAKLYDQEKQEDAVKLLSKSGWLEQSKLII